MDIKGVTQQQESEVSKSFEEPICQTPETTRKPANYITCPNTKITHTTHTHTLQVTSWVTPDIETPYEGMGMDFRAPIETPYMFWQFDFINETKHR